VKVFRLLKERTLGAKEHGIWKRPRADRTGKRVFEDRKRLLTDKSFATEKIRGISRPERTRK